MPDHLDPYDYGAELLAAGAVDGPPPPVDEYDPPEDPVRADRIARRRAHELAEIAAIESTYETLRAQLDAWRADMTEGRRRQVEYLEQVLANYGRACGKRTIKLPHATIQTGKGRARLEVVDEAAYLAWAGKAAPELTVTPEPVTKPAPIPEIKKALHAPSDGFGDDPLPVGATEPFTEPAVTVAGEIVPGLRWVNDGRTYGVK